MVSMGNLASPDETWELLPHIKAGFLKVWEKLTNSSQLVHPPISSAFSSMLSAWGTSFLGSVSLTHRVTSTVSVVRPGLSVFPCLLLMGPRVPSTALQPSSSPVLPHTHGLLCAF